MPDPAEERASEPEDVRELIMRTGLSWGNADLLALGKRRTLERLGEFAAYFAFAGDRQGNRPAARGVRVIVPPLRFLGADASLAALRAGFEEGVAKAFDGKAPAGTAEGAFPCVNLVSMLAFDGAHLIDLIGRPGARAAMIVGETCHYRLPGIARGASSAMALDEDVWSVQVHALLVRAEKTVKNRGSYVLFDLGAYLPARAANTELLCSVGVNGVAFPGKPAEEVAAQVERLHALAMRGELGPAIAEIDGDPDLTERTRLLLKLETLSVAGAQPQVREMLRDIEAIVPGLAPDEALAVARLAEGVDDDELAERLLSANVGQLRSRRDLERALSVAVGTGRKPPSGLRALADARLPRGCTSGRLRRGRRAARDERRSRRRRPEGLVRRPG